jgi:peptidoglycan-associated lipoprotein
MTSPSRSFIDRVLLGDPPNTVPARKALLKAILIAGLIVGMSGLLATGGCTRKNAMGTADTEAGGSAASKDKNAGKGPYGSDQSFVSPRGSDRFGNDGLKGFAGKPSEESIADPLGRMLAKADPQASRSRKGDGAGEDNRRTLADVYFSYDQWDLSEAGKKNLAESAAFLKANPGVAIYIEGHCDERGSHDYNLILGEKRAKETARHLQTLGIRNPVMVASYGKEHPVCAEHEESCYWRNRRAHLAVDASK